MKLLALILEMQVMIFASLHECGWNDMVLFHMIGHYGGAV